jgi:hypothetical protein
MRHAPMSNDFPAGALSNCQIVELPNSCFQLTLKKLESYEPQEFH